MKSKANKVLAVACFRTNSAKKKSTKKKNKKNKLVPKSRIVPQNTSTNSTFITLTQEMWGQSQQNVQQWQYKHQIAYWKSKAMALEYQNRVLHEQIRNSKLSSQVEDSVSQSSATDSEDEVTDESSEYTDSTVKTDDEKMEVSEAFMDFLIGNAKHKEKIKHEKEIVEAYDVEVMAAKAMELPPIQNNHLQREEEMKLLYGEHSDEISCMEASVQLDFDRLSDKHKPVLWPNIPLKL